MKTQLEKIYTMAVSDLEQAKSVAELEDIKLKYLSRKGEFNEIKKGLKNLSDDDKKIIGRLANEINQNLESALKNKYDEFYKKDTSNDDWDSAINLAKADGSWYDY